MMWIDKEVVKSIAYPIIKENFPNLDGLTIYRDSENYDWHIDVCIPESDYIADLLVSDVDLDDIARRVVEEIEKHGSDDRVFIKRVTSVHEWDSKTLKRLSLGC